MKAQNNIGNQVFPYKFTSSNIAKVFKKNGMDIVKKIKVNYFKTTTEGVRVFSVKGNIIVAYEVPRWIVDKVGEKEAKKRAEEGVEKMYNIATENGIQPIINGKKASLKDILKTRSFVAKPIVKSFTTLENALRSKRFINLANKIKNM